MKKRPLVSCLALLVALFASGCGGGLPVTVKAVPSSAAPGTTVNYEVTVQNTTECLASPFAATVPGGSVAPLPDPVGARVVVIGFDPDAPSAASLAQICRLLASCTTLPCVGGILGETLGTERAQPLLASLEGAKLQPLPSAKVNGDGPTCVPIANDESGVTFECYFPEIEPGQSLTATHTETAPDSGNRSSVQIAFSYGLAIGEDCRPGLPSPSGPNEWLLAGCYPLAVPQPAPALSTGALGSSVLVVLAVGVVALVRRRWR